MIGYAGRWEAHYAAGGTSGPGSEGRHAQWKADVVNDVIRAHAVRTVLEFGCGDGQQLARYDVPTYTGLDVAPTAVQMCRDLFRGDPSKTFQHYQPGRLHLPPCDMTMAVETLMHVLDDAAFAATVADLFAHAARFVLICDPLTELDPWGGPEWVRMRNLRPILAGYDGFEVCGEWLHPDVTQGDRDAGVVGSMASDFLLLRRVTAST